MQFVIKNDLIFLCVYFELEAITVTVFRKSAIDIHQNIFWLAALERLRTTDLNTIFLT